MRTLPSAFAVAVLCAWTLARLGPNVSAAPQNNTTFDAGCTLPFDAIKFKHPIDNTCGHDGEGSQRSRLQNRMKNNFCASGVPRTLTIANFRQLQRAAVNAGFRMGGPSSPTDPRSDYAVTLPSGANWKEGDLARLVGFVIDAHYSNSTTEGENVNCNHGGDDWNDIHISVAPSKTEDDLCNAVIVEMSPHFRPKAWTEITHFSTNRPVRFTGPLFFDASHGACAQGGRRAKPPRIATWELHPIHRVDVCSFKSLANCPANSNTVWTPFDEWVTSEDDDEDQ